MCSLDAVIKRDIYLTQSVGFVWHSMGVSFWSTYCVQYYVLGIMEAARRAEGASVTRTFPGSREMSHTHTLEYSMVCEKYHVSGTDEGVPREFQGRRNLGVE